MRRKVLCTHEVEMKRGGEPIGQITFEAGREYDLVGQEQQDFLVWNELGFAHPIPPKFFRSHFRHVTAAISEAAVPAAADSP